MRITCPNCNATYEVGDADIPAEGIEVECSACLKRWMQMPDADAGAADAPAPEAVSEPDPVSEDVPVATPDVRPAPEPASVAEVNAPVEPAPAPSAFSPPEPEPESEDMATAAPAWPADEDALQPPPSEPSPSAPPQAWRVPTPPAESLQTTDPLDNMLAALNAAPQAEARQEAGPSDPEPVPAQSVDSAEPSGPATDTESAGAEDAEIEVSADIAPDMPAPVAAPMPAPEMPPEPPLAAAAADNLQIPAASAPSAPISDPILETEAAIGGVAAIWQSFAAQKAAAIKPDVPEAIVPEAGVDATEADAAPAEGMQDESMMENVVDPAETPSVETDFAAPTPVEPPEKRVPHWSEGLNAVPERKTAEQSITDLIDELQADASPRISEDRPDAVEPAPRPEAAPLDPPADDPENEVVFHPWEGETAPVIAPEAAAAVAADSPMDKPADTPLEDDFEWEEATPDPISAGASEPEAAVASEAEYTTRDQEIQARLRPAPPVASNVIQANILQAPLATMGRVSRAAVAETPRKPTPVDSPEDIESAIRSQMVNFQEPDAEGSPEKTGILGGKPKAPAKPAAEPQDPLKAALREPDASAPRSKTRTGFLAVMILFLLALALYMFGDNIATMVPALAPVLHGFSGLVDGIRGLL